MQLFCCWWGECNVWTGDTAVLHKKYGMHCVYSYFFCGEMIKIITKIKKSISEL